ncbi:hypothetical protein HPB49_021525 [Dermacentor silvarum]|uniref:Uncharacterized protein n=1 Tax=Dermacentor silvarum TaxID=543639 RepID=A0ACB8C5J5_DERSI|nr:hypothetical protein HPB49_021525 [Dermacentor silvarum]
MMTSQPPADIFELPGEEFVADEYGVGATTVVTTAIVNLTPAIFTKFSRALGATSGPGVSWTSDDRVPFLPPTPPVAIQVLDFLNTAYMPIVIYLGLIGNLLSLVTFLCTKLRSRTSSLYMGALAASDSGFLVVLSFAWLSERGVNMYKKDLCPATVFLSSAFACWSVWLTVSFTAERFLAVCYPLCKLRTSFRNRRPRIIIAATAVFSAALNAPLPAFVSIADSDFEDCSPHPDYERVAVALLDTMNRSWQEHARGSRRACWDSGGAAHAERSARVQDRFPSDSAQKAAWTKAVRRENFAPTKYSVVCEHHFLESDFVDSMNYTDSMTGKVIEVPLKLRRLKPAAIPSVFPNCPVYLSRQETSARGSP